MCLIDDHYLCICISNPRRAECFTSDHSLDQCDRCHDGALCQFDIEQLGFTLDSLLVDMLFDVQLIYFSLTLLIFLAGAATNAASFVTFQRPKTRKLSVANYLLVLPVLNQFSLFNLLIKIIHVVFASSVGDLTCKLLSYLLSSTTRSSYWLTSWVTVERVLFVLFPFGTLLGKPHWALLISVVTLIIVAAMHTHELLFYISVKDPDGQMVCASTMLATISTYNRVTAVIHYLVPVCIQIISITLLIVLAARSRSRTTGNHQQNSSIMQLIKQQLDTQKELYLTPSIIVLSGLPQTILSFSFACLTLSSWQRHALFIAYLFSYAPELLGFILFVMPSTLYLDEFRKTPLARTRLFRWTVAHSSSRTDVSITHRATM